MCTRFPDASHLYDGFVCTLSTVYRYNVSVVIPCVEEEIKKKQGRGQVDISAHCSWIRDDKDRLFTWIDFELAVLSLHALYFTI